MQGGFPSFVVRLIRTWTGGLAAVLANETGSCYPRESGDLVRCSYIYKSRGIRVMSGFNNRWVFLRWKQGKPNTHQRGCFNDFFAFFPQLDQIN